MSGIVRKPRRKKNVGSTKQSPAVAQAQGFDPEPEPKQRAGIRTGDASVTGSMYAIRLDSRNLY
jgi:hypothetical protein